MHFLDSTKKCIYVRLVRHCVQPKTHDGDGIGGAVSLILLTCSMDGWDRLNFSSPKYWAQHPIYEMSFLMKSNWTENWEHRHDMIQLFPLETAGPAPRLGCGGCWHFREWRAQHGAAWTWWGMGGREVLLDTPYILFYILDKKVVAYYVNNLYFKCCCDLYYYTVLILLMKYRYI